MDIDSVVLMSHVAILVLIVLWIWAIVGSDLSQSKKARTKKEQNEIVKKYGRTS